MEKNLPTGTRTQSSNKGPQIQAQVGLHTQNSSEAETSTMLEAAATVHSLIHALQHCSSHCLEIAQKQWHLVTTSSAKKKSS